MPSNISYANIHLNRMKAAVEECRYALQNSPGLEGDCKIIQALALEAIREIAALTEVFSDENPNFINAEQIIDEIGACFSDAADKVEDRRCNPSEPSFAAA